jgi:hypothetical protein
MLRTAALVVTLPALLLAGCRASLPRTTTQPAVPTDSNAELVDYIGNQPYVTAEAAYRAVYILWRGEVFEGDYDALVGELEEGRLIASGWHHAPDDFVDRAAVGYLVARACDIRTGLNWQLLGLGRYAWRELIYHRIAHASSEYGLISGGEFLGVLARAEEYLHDVGRAPSEKARLGTEPPP